ncbi:MAG TPA: DUF4296 domain-containing protein [Chitinophagaceae bacterium]|jgi:hypothetical protein|nr:DUF4296 domain-containing protein [Chitinophagaceae bacterium]
MRTGLVIILSLFLSTGCKNKNRVPRNIIPQQKMKAILWDMMRADQFLSDYVLNRDTSLKIETESFKYYQQIFAIHKINRDEFWKSFSFYRSRPDLLKTILDSISAPPHSATVLQPTQVTTPLVIPDSTVQPARRIHPDTSPLHKKRPVSVE